MLDIIKEGILAEFLLKNKTEVIKGSIYEYDKEFEEKKLEKGKSIEQIAVELEESREAVQKIVNELK